MYTVIIINADEDPQIEYYQFKKCVLDTILSFYGIS